MPNHTALAVANEIIRRRHSSISPNQTQLQKFVFNSHWWNLAINGSPLISDQAQAWDNGPVYRSIWDHIRDYGHKGNDRLLIDPRTDYPFSSEFTTDELNVIERTFRKYNPLWV